MSRLQRYHQRLQCSRTAIIAGILPLSMLAIPAYAQDATASADETISQDSIVVTARRKSEDILRTPITLNALTSEELVAKGAATIQDIAQSVPGMNVQNAATTGGRADRSFTSIQIRGFVPSTSSAQTASIFIDGAPVSVATALQALTNPERVEVIKGPQSALFGRQTFAGAINVVTKASSDRLSGGGSFSIGTRGNYDIQGEISTPIIEDVLGIRVSGRYVGKNGSYKNAGNRSETLGDQSTLTGSVAIEFTPTSSLTFKAFGLATELDDGPAATGLIAANTIPGVTVGQSNCRVRTSNWFCGVAPKLSALTPAANTNTSPALDTFLNLKNGQPYVNNLGTGAGTVGRVLSPDESVDGYGLVNHFRHVHLNIDWELGDSGFALHSLTAYNSEKKAELADLDNTYSTSLVGARPGITYPIEGYYNFPFMIQAKSHDFSQELRSTFENGGPVHASLGGSYLYSKAQSDSGSPFLGSLTYGGIAQSRTYGVFGSLGYDFSDQFSLSADARYQIDKLYAFAGQTGFIDRINNVTIAANDLITSATFKTFLPRVIGQFNWDSRNMIYASYSKGVNPGAFNTTFPASAEPQVRAMAAELGFQVAVQPEKITNYEIGAKGRLFDKVTYEVAGFYALWTDQIQNQSISFNKLPNSAVPVDQQGGPAAVGSPLQVTANVNSGRVRVYGAEASFGIKVAEGLDLDLSGAYVETYILSANNTTVSNFYYGIPNASFRGKENPYVSKWSGTASLAYEKPIKDELMGFGRADFSYKRGGWADINNTVRAPDLTQLNMRAGVKNKTFTAEAYVTNVLNNKAYYNISSQGLITAVTPAGTGAYGALVAQLRDLRTAGVRFSVNF
jgi:iron complex outermembrane receptor protein